MEETSVTRITAAIMPDAKHLGKEDWFWDEFLSSSDKQDLHPVRDMLVRASCKAHVCSVSLGALTPFLGQRQHMVGVSLLYSSRNTVKHSLLVLLQPFKPLNVSSFPKYPVRVLEAWAWPRLPPQFRPLSYLASSIFVCSVTVEYITEWTVRIYLWFLFNSVNGKKSLSFSVYVHNVYPHRRHRKPR